MCAALGQPTDKRLTQTRRRLCVSDRVIRGPAGRCKHDVVPELGNKGCVIERLHRPRDFEANKVRTRFWLLDLIVTEREGSKNIQAA